MTANELDDVTALLERVLPDPRGFAERVFGQLVTRLSAAGGLAESGSLDPDAFAASSASPAAPYESNEPHVLLACALGACDCWGFSADCAVCNGAGFSGWRQPDLALFHEFVGPAVQRLSANEPQGCDGFTADRDHENDPTKQGGIA
jgi:hypothetical protein